MSRTASATGLATFTRALGRSRGTPRPSWSRGLSFQSWSGAADLQDRLPYRFGDPELLWPGKVLPALLPRDLSFQQFHHVIHPRTSLRAASKHPLSGQNLHARSISCDSSFGKRPFGASTTWSVRSLQLGYQPRHARIVGQDFGDFFAWGSAALGSPTSRFIRFLRYECRVNHVLQGTTLISVPASRIFSSVSSVITVSRRDFRSSAPWRRARISRSRVFRDDRFCVT